MPKRHPVRSPQFMKAIRDVHAFFQESMNKNGHVEERFSQFTDISQDQTANALFQDAKQVLLGFNCASKLVAQTYNGAAVMAGEHAGLQAKLREHYKDAVFVYCYAHRLNLVLSQSVSFIKQVKIFFTSVSGFGTLFFSKSTKRVAALVSKVKKRFPSVAPKGGTTRED
jgi:small basic protein